MIVFERIEYKNILSVGNKSIEISLNKFHKTIITGKNGAGKTTLSDAIFFVLFGKPYRNINKNDIINSINRKNLQVSIWFTNRGNSYRVIRGLKPNIFEVYENEKLVPQDSKALDYQKRLEEKFLGIDYDTMRQISVIGTTNYIPFMRLTTPKRREFIENILKVNVFTDMNALTKTKIQENKEKLLENDKNRQIQNNKLTIIKGVITTYKKEESESQRKLDQDLSDTSEKISLLLEQKSSVLEQLIVLRDSSVEAYLKMEPLLNGWKDKNAKHIHHKDSLEKTKDFITSHSSCPTCLQEITNLTREEFLNTYKNSKEQIDVDEKKLLAIKDILDEKLKKHDENTEKLNELKSKLDSIDNELYGEETMYKMLEKNKLMVDNSEKIREKLVEAKEIKLQLEKLEKEYQELNREKYLLGLSIGLLKDDGIKAHIINQYIPTLNDLIDYHLNLLNFYVQFNLDESFNEVIKSRHRDTFKYDNFSEGEKQRIDLAILFSFRKLSELRFSVNTNLIILDETLDASIDTDGIQDLMKVIDENETNNIFVISHKNSLWEVFDGHLEFEKKNNFTILKGK